MKVKITFATICYGQTKSDTLCYVQTWKEAYHAIANLLFWRGRARNALIMKEKYNCVVTVTIMKIRRWQAKTKLGSKEQNIVYRAAKYKRHNDYAIANLLKATKCSKSEDKSGMINREQLPKRLTRITC